MKATQMFLCTKINVLYVNAASELYEWLEKASGCPWQAKNKKNRIGRYEKKENNNNTDPGIIVSQSHMFSLDDGSIA